MNRIEFMAELERLLADMPQEERRLRFSIMQIISRMPVRKTRLR